jgi:hypothetical protein
MRNLPGIKFVAALAALIVCAILLAGIPQRAFRRHAADRQEQADVEANRPRARTLSRSGSQDHARLPEKAAQRAFVIRRILRSAASSSPPKACC